MRLREVNLGSFNTHLGLVLGGGLAVIVSALAISRELGPWFWVLMALGILGTTAGVSGMVLDGWRAWRPTASVQTGSRFSAEVSYGEEFVLLEPLDGAVVGQKVAIRGFCHTFEANVAIEEKVNAEWQLRGLTTAAGWTDRNTLHAFKTTISLDVGKHHLRVGDRTARDGTWFGVEVVINVK
jgi:Immunoglobulin-like domain of bacterial spore germination